MEVEGTGIKEENKVIEEFGCDFEDIVRIFNQNELSHYDLNRVRKRIKNKSYLSSNTKKNTKQIC
jgi:hypothetical protein